MPQPGFSTSALPYHSRLVLTEERRQSKADYQQKLRLVAQKEAKQRKEQETRVRGGCRGGCRGALAQMHFHGAL